MKILIVAPYTPFPPDTGGRIRIFEEINILSQKHEVAVASFVYTKDELKKASGLQKLCAKFEPVMYTNAIKVQRDVPDMAQRYITPEMRETILAIRKEFMPDVAILQHVYMSYYRPLLPQFTILEEQNIESKILENAFCVINKDFSKPLIRTYATWFFENTEYQAKLLADYENTHWPHYPLRITVSDLDKKEMDARCIVGESVVINNGVDIASRQIIPQKFPLLRSIIFFGSLDYYPNLDGLTWFISEILPIIWDSDPTIQFLIAGRNPPKGLKKICDDKRITIVANPSSIRSVAQYSSIAVVPLRIGGGTRLKILDAMSLGLPVISTSLGCEGLEVADQENILIKDEVNSFASSVVSLLDDRNSYLRIRENARKLVEKSYTWENVYSKLESKIIEHL